MSQKRLQDQLNSGLWALTDRQRIVLELRYGLGDRRPRTLEETAAALMDQETGRHPAITRERVRVIESQALHILFVNGVLTPADISAATRVEFIPWPPRPATDED